jgi:hypothetical protein
MYVHVEKTTQGPIIIVARDDGVRLRVRAPNRKFSPRRNPDPTQATLVTAEALGSAGVLARWSCLMWDIERLSDESVRKLYENIRLQVAHDVQSGSRHRFMGETARQQAERLRGEMDRRRLRFTPIDW